MNPTTVQIGLVPVVIAVVAAVGLAVWIVYRVVRRPPEQRGFEVKDPRESN